MKVLLILSVSAALAVLLALASPSAYAQAKIDPDHFDMPNSEPVAHPRRVDNMVPMAGYDRAFSLPYSVLCDGKKLCPGGYAIAVRSNGEVGQATLNQKRHAIEIAGVIHTEACNKQREEVVVVENSKTGRRLSFVQVRGFDFVFDPKHSTNPSPHGNPTPG